MYSALSLGITHKDHNKFVYFYYNRNEADTQDFYRYWYLLLESPARGERLVVFCSYGPLRTGLKQQTEEAAEPAADEGW